ncbi:polynucleotide 5'-hydroxyl-kinase NOL9 isoform X2 [Anopheles moucheti]|uniref:polynucleotide 5'-hydroxyl-kinase NOL9 isoform X2 n=1 Tax=Anopheles moucheti TaxID=186751 RepID=UPI0022F0F61E|nr:polynucleotide 5'-hydroxyl-kinase NOL9 isoform X2 [Anopheles moucheti]
MGKKKSLKENLTSANGQKKCIQTAAATNNRAKKRGAQFVTERTGNGTNVSPARRPKTNQSGWVVETGECHPSTEGNTAEKGSAKPVNGNKIGHKQGSSFTASPKALALAYRRNDCPIDGFDSDECDSSIDDSSGAEHNEGDISFESSSYDSDYDDAEEDDHSSDYNMSSYESDSCDEEADDFSSDDDFRKYMSGQEVYNSDSDEDYEQTKHDDTVHIPQGSAVLHDLPDETVQFDPSCTRGQIIEIEYNTANGSAEVENPIEAKQAEKVEEGNEELDESEGEDSSSILKSLPENTPKNAEYRFYNAVDLRMALAVLKAPIYICGHLSVQILCGKIEMWGYTLDTAEKRTVYASEGYNAINITPVPSPDTYSKGVLHNICRKLKPHFIASDINELMKQFDPVNSVLVLLRADTFNASDTVPLVCKLLPDMQLFPTSLTVDQMAPYSTTEILLEIALFPPTVKNVPLFQANPAWDAIELKPDSRLMVVGGKGSGKSTLCQYLINKHIKHFGRILLVDLDIGQPLLFLPETISASVVREPILGVGCFATVQPHKCHLFGSLNVVSSPLLYVQNVRSLVQYCAEHPDLSGIPWIVNTMGYVVGFGEELTTAIVRLVQPTDVVQLTFTKESKKLASFAKTQNYANELKAELVNEFKFNILYDEVKVQPNPVHYNFHSFEVSYEPSKLSFFPPKRRTIAIMAELVKILDDAAETFADVKPYVARVNDLQILITRDEHRPSQEMLLRTLNATLVYLCAKDEKGQYNCSGVGIVRSVDDENIYLLHALSPEQLANVTVLALCNTSLPGQVYLQPSPNVEVTIPYLQNLANSIQSA